MTRFRSCAQISLTVTRTRESRRTDMPPSGRCAVEGSAAGPMLIAFETVLQTDYGEHRRPSTERIGSWRIPTNLKGIASFARGLIKSWRKIVPPSQADHSGTTATQGAAGLLGNPSYTANVGDTDVVPQRCDRNQSRSSSILGGSWFLRTQRSTEAHAVMGQQVASRGSRAVAVGLAGSRPTSAPSRR